jgi:predicted Zn-dependent peptidase
MGIARSSTGGGLDSVKPHSVSLANGAQLVLLELPAAHKVAIVAQLRIGSRYEAAEDNGLSHLLEHMLYRGVPGHPTAHEQALAFESLGGTLVAGTGAESGSLSIACPPGSFERTLDLFARVYSEPLLLGLEVEKGIIREEILEHLDENGGLIDDYDLLRATAFEGHSLGYPVTGTVEGLERFDVARVRRHHEERYVGCSTVISVAGPIDVEATARALEARFGVLPRGVPPATTPPAPQRGLRVKFVKSSSSQTGLRVGFRGSGLHDVNEPATEVLLRILDDGNSTRLYTRLCDERGLAYDVAAGYEASDDAGLLDIGSDTAHAQADTVLGEVLSVVRTLRDEGPTEAELDKAKARHRWGLEEMMDNPSEAADFLADCTLRGYARTPSERRDQLDAVTTTAVRRAAEGLFLPERLSAVIVGLPHRRAQSKLEKILQSFA